MRTHTRETPTMRGSPRRTSGSFKCCLMWCAGLTLVLWAVSSWQEGSRSVVYAGYSSAFQFTCKDMPDFPIGKFDGNLLCKHDRGFQQASHIFNIKQQQTPMVIVQPRTSEAVGHILRTAMSRDIPITIKGGGHSPAGWAVEEGVVMIDMSLMKGIKVNPMEKTLWAEGGVKWDEVLPHIERHNLSYVGGECPQVGVVGIAMGGGTGWLSRSYGLVSDNILSLEMVFPNGTLVEVSPTKNAHLLWALSGAGHGNFGVVTSIKYRLHPAEPRYFAGHLCYALERNELRRFAKAYSSAISEITDNRLTAYHVLRRNWRQYEGERYEACYTIVFNGPMNQGLEAARPLLKAVSNALDMKVACRKTPRCYLRLEDAPSQHLLSRRAMLSAGKPFAEGLTFTELGRLYGGETSYVHWRNGIIKDMDDSVMDALVDVMLDEDLYIQGQYDVVQVQINHNGGAIAYKDDNHSSYPHRKSKFVVSLHGFISGTLNKNSVNRETDKQMYDWITRSFKKLQPLFNGAFPNYSDAELDDWEHMYYGKNLEELRRIKHEIVGHQVFRTNQRL